MLSAIAASTSALTSALTASCYCGAIKLRVLDPATPPTGASICHCATCRRLTGAPMLANLLLASDRLELTPPDAALTSLKTSKHVTRHRCAGCSSPVYATLGKGKVVVPLSLFSSPHPASWAPQHHLYYDRRVLDVGDDLPKFKLNYGGPEWTGEPPEAGPEAE